MTVALLLPHGPRGVAPRRPLGAAPVGEEVGEGMEYIQRIRLEDERSLVFGGGSSEQAIGFDAVMSLLVFIRTNPVRCPCR